MKFSDILSHLGIAWKKQGHEHCRPGWLQLDCPWCAKYGHFRLGFNLRGQYLNCWSCGPHGVVPTLMEITHQPYKVISKLAGDIESERNLPDLPKAGVLKVPKGMEDTLQHAHREYLMGRGFNPDRIQRLWKIKGIGAWGKELSWRLWIPIHYKGETVSWTTRSISDKHALRYRSAAIEQEKINHKKLLYGEDYCTHAIIICEGPLDVWKIGPGAVATCGIGYSQAQLARMVKYPVRVVAFDTDRDGQRRARKLVKELTGLHGETFNARLNAKDPGSASVEEIRELRKRFLLKE